MSRPERLVLVVGTATDIGKTWVGGQVLERLRRDGVAVAARKPAQSAEADDPGPSDAAVLAAASGEDPATVCPPHRSYRVAMAPPMAADATGLAEPTIDELLGELTWPQPPVAIGWLETVGGPRSPIGADGDAVTVADRLDPDLVVLVADAGLGTINAVLLSLAPFAGRRCTTFLNRFDPDDDLHRRNVDWLRTRERLEVHTDLEALVATVRG
ncbi:MAG: AAA family ATPase [Acidimicrobiales bacterium]|nr:AAA family ATPase [Acidimicrobiales bacterium]